MVDQLNIECSRLTTEAQISELRDRVKKYALAKTHNTRLCLQSSRSLGECYLLPIVGHIGYLAVRVKRPVPDYKL